MNIVEIYTFNWCPYSKEAKKLLNRYNGTFIEYDVTDKGPKFDEMFQRSGSFTVPQIFFNGSHHIGGYSELKKYYEE